MPERDVENKDHLFIHLSFSISNMDDALDCHETIRMLGKEGTWWQIKKDIGIDPNMLLVGYSEFLFGKKRFEKSRVEKNTQTANEHFLQRRSYN